MSYFTSLGLLRQLLIGMAIICLFVRPEPGSRIELEGLQVMPTLITPASVPILIMVILFDALMSKIRASDSEGEERIRFKKILRVELATVLILFLAWLPFFMAIGK